MNSQLDNGLIWITGYSGSGKTTVARIVSEKLKKMGVAVVLLDGDDLRSIFGERYGHTLSDRRQLAYVYSRLCKRISDCGVTVVIATVAMFEQVRMENRVANERYLEVYLNVPLAVREERDPKGLYRAALACPSNSDDFPTSLEEPLNPDLVIGNYGEISPEMAASLISSKWSAIEFKKNQYEIGESLLSGSELSQNLYWDSFYLKRKAPINPSSFAIFCNENYLARSCRILEFGCGNGRDSFYFSKTHRITAIDESVIVVDANRTRAIQEGILSLDFLQGHFGSVIQGLPNEVDAVYGRFVIHAMPEDAAKRALQESWRLLKNGGKLFLEFRTNRDPLMAEGRHIGESERITDHYRRFINFEKFCESLLDLGFNLEFAIEKNGLATYGSDDPVVGRIVAIKRVVY